MVLAGCSQQTVVDRQLSLADKQQAKIDAVCKTYAAKKPDDPTVFQRCRAMNCVAGICKPNTVINGL
jgi:hypothetical protein